MQFRVNGKELKTPPLDLQMRDLFDVNLEADPLKQLLRLCYRVLTRLRTADRSEAAAYLQSPAAEDRRLRGREQRNTHSASGNRIGSAPL
jgi:hypothetical protein